MCKFCVTYLLTNIYVQMIFSYNYSTRVSIVRRHLSRISVQGVLAEPREGVVRSLSQLITARGSGGALKAPPAGSGAEPQPPMILVHLRLKRKHLVLYNLAFSGK